MNLSDLSSTIELASKCNNLEEIRSLLCSYYNDLVHLYENELLEIDYDYREGKDTYGYESLETIQYNLFYISDRWRASFRVRWLIDLINPDYILYKEIKK